METKNQRNYARRKQRRELWFAAHGPCARCDSWESLTLDHIDPTSKDPRLKGGNAGSIWAWSEAGRAVELAKCQALCWPCHTAKTLQERGGPAEHGTRSKYKKCRCEACCKAQSDYMQEYGKTYYMTYDQTRRARSRQLTKEQ